MILESLIKAFYIIYGSPPLSVVLLSAVSITHSSLHPKILYEKFQKKFVSFKLHTILNSVMKSHFVLLFPTQDVNHPFVQYIHAGYTTSPISHLVAITY